MSYFLNLVAEYGYILIYVLLTIELMGIPFLPGEILIVYCGFLVYQNKLNFILVVICAAFGVLTGMSLSYFIGKKLGKPFFYKHGKRL
ncbi:MAG: DedA family protein, partial [Sarcina sp.]